MKTMRRLASRWRAAERAGTGLSCCPGWAGSRRPSRQPSGSGSLKTRTRLVDCVPIIGRHTDRRENARDDAIDEVPWLARKPLSNDILGVITQSRLVVSLQRPRQRARQEFAERFAA